MQNKNSFPLPFLAGVLLAAILSCNSNTKSAGNEAPKPDSTTASTPSADPTLPGYPMLLIKHKVADYDKWRAAYDQH